MERQKTVSARKLTVTIAFIVVTAVAAIYGYTFSRPHEQASLHAIPIPALCLEYGLEQVDPPVCNKYAEVADTFEERTKGLGGRESLPEGSGMLFVFDVPGSYCFWMKDMKFAVDMLWIDTDKKIQKLVENVAPDTYPQQYCSEGGTRYVLEVNANTARLSGFVPGTVLKM